MTAALMLQGTGSDVGKSLLVAGLARAYTRRGLTVRPFKPQNMSNNAALAAIPEAHAGVEGAGSPAEVNLRRGDIANMGFATVANVPVVLVGDIERGGVLAALVGTWTLLSEAERTLLRGYIVNKFRGDIGLFEDAPAIIAEHTGLESFGIVPWFSGAALLPAEDTASLDSRLAGNSPSVPAGAIHIVVPRLPRIANFDDLDPLAAESDVCLEFVSPGQPLPGGADLYLLPGSKSTRADLAALRSAGWDQALLAAAQSGARIFGICGGYQMLGRTVADPGAVEGPAGSDAGLSLLDIATEIDGTKRLAAAFGQSPFYDAPVEGYEMHMGRTTGPDTHRNLLSLQTPEGPRPDGAISPNGRIAGCYVHGLFAGDAFRHAFLKALQPERGTGAAWQAMIARTLDELADHLESHLDLETLLAVARNR